MTMLNLCKLQAVGRLLFTNSFKGRNVHLWCKNASSCKKKFLLYPENSLELYIIRFTPCMSQRNYSKTPNDGKSSRIKNIVEKVIPLKKEEPQRTSQVTRERNFLTTLRAMSEFLLNPKHLEGLPSLKRRSPHENEPPITVYWRKDVEKRAKEVWGSLEALEKEKKRRKSASEALQQSMKKRMSDIYRGVGSDKKSIFLGKKRSSDSAGYVVWAAVAVNSLNLLVKFCAWLYTGSHSLFAEVLHSFADVTNQLILAYGIHKSKQDADVQHPYGFTSMRYISSLISGAMIFCIGSGLSFYHGVSGLMSAQELMPLSLGIGALLVSFATEGITLIMAVQATRRGAQSRNVSFKDYVLRGNDPTVNVILLEDFAAVLSVVIAISCMSATSFYGSHVPDAVGSVIIGGILAYVSGFIVKTNTNALVGRSISPENLNAINNELEEDVMIRAIHDVKGIDIGSGLVRYKAEVDVDGRELTKAYLSKKDINLLYNESRLLKNPEEMEKFLLIHGENIVDSLGGEVDRIEKNIKKKHPEVRHIDLEVL